MASLQASLSRAYSTCTSVIVMKGDCPLTGKPFKAFDKCCQRHSKGRGLYSNFRMAVGWGRRTLFSPISLKRVTDRNINLQLRSLHPVCRAWKR